MKVASRRGLSYLQSSVLAWRRRIRHRVATTIEVSDESATAEFRCHSAIEERRAVSLFHKEAGTIAWLRQNVKPGQIVFDVGANVGIYTVLAAQLTGPAGKVFAFEPHAANFSSLIENIALNQLELRCVPLSVALSNRPDFLPFHYASLTAGSSMSQLGRPVDPDGREVDKGISEIKAATSLDHLLAERCLPPPHHVKIDVDGIEADIVDGMQQLLAEDTPLSIQVEVQPDTRVPVIDRMRKYGFGVDHCHHTECGKQQIEAGFAPEEVTHNIVFKRGER